MYVYVCPHIYVHTCIKNVTPGNMSSIKENISDYRYERTNTAAKRVYL